MKDIGRWFLVDLTPERNADDIRSYLSVLAFHPRFSAGRGNSEDERHQVDQDSQANQSRGYEGK